MQPACIESLAATFRDAVNAEHDSADTKPIAAAA
jgi:hypothetical protein